MVVDTDFTGVQLLAVDTSSGVRWDGAMLNILATDAFSR